MHDPHYELHLPRQEITTTSTQPARYAAGPSKDGLSGDASAPGVAEALGRQGAPEGEQPVDSAAAVPPKQLPCTASPVGASPTRTASARSESTLATASRRRPTSSAWRGR